VKITKETHGQQVQAFVVLETSTEVEAVRRGLKWLADGNGNWGNDSKVIFDRISEAL